ncbi:ABC transporter ATP-binding protein [Synechococcus sp. PCC 7336]|uniref:ABC transporter ATP-binding protein n=1 Tax=Synechococcus sp. PCC 7336 TaxID=195250 RepID=UPI0003485995|nr:ABC transporter ATP-binding protein [Synechococcus sp. PCC 7336]
MAGVVFDRVTRRYGDFTAVSELSLAVRDREFLVLVGPSGCGKTTTLRMLAGLEEVSSGEISIGDRRVNDVPSKDRDIAMVFQSYALYPHMTVYENMAFSLTLRGMNQAEISRRVTEAAQQMGIESLLHRKPAQLSGGQRQRVAVGRAIVRDPAVFLMDEPLSNLDAKLRVQARAEISKLHQKLGATFVYVTHDQVEAMTMGSRIAVLKDGVLQQIDTPANLYNHPKNVFVAEFIGSPSMNLFAALLLDRDGDLVVKTEAFELKLPERKAEQFRPYRDLPVIFGLRPENIHDPQYPVPDISPESVTAKVSVMEMMGNEVVVYLESPDGSEFVARIDPRTAMKVGDSVPLWFDMEGLHLFDRDRQTAIQCVR